MFKRLRAITHKEFLHIIRDPRTLGIIFLMPIVELLLLGYAATTDIEYLPTAVLDWDRTSQSRGLGGGVPGLCLFQPRPHGRERGPTGRLDRAG